MKDGEKELYPHVSSHTYQADLPALERIAQVLAAQLQAGDVLLLYGSLGAGKTTFTQFLARALEVGEDDYVSSPSFALVHEYLGRLPVFHMDLYRLAGEDDVEAGGLVEYFEAQGIVVVEWPERLGIFTPQEYLALAFKGEQAEKPTLTLSAHGNSWRQRLGLIHNLLLPFSADPTKQNGCTCCS
ncbi:MAG: tRNA (adenosine(37)-N6)-threonylcarbamoyltransferase complex ATPase subunit type 1 TsaE [bacterium]|nr:tRNA (adenosine(37)-N6)-threonylcarbamoyltransferase complex ATPase subunit type 1 TsaE [bacterium]